ncbi:MAG: LuxR C-terminal-related transcriptional regulator [Anaerolineales bacterium]
MSERKVEILRLIAQGYINAEIADKLYLKRSTMRSYVSLGQFEPQKHVTPHPPESNKALPRPPSG